MNLLLETDGISFGLLVLVLVLVQKLRVNLLNSKDKY